MTPTTSSSPAQVVESIYAAFNRGDIAHIAAQVAPNATWRQSKTLPWGGDYTGPEGAIQFFTRLDAAMKTVAFEPGEMIVAGNDVFSLGEYEGKSVRTGKTARARWLFRWRVDGGKIVQHDGHIDTAALAAVL